MFSRPNDLEISEIEFLNGEYNVIGRAFNINTLRDDIACKGKIKSLSNLNDNNTLLDVDIQINWL